jgi:hypothetical protein
MDFAGLGFLNCKRVLGHIAFSMIELHSSEQDLMKKERGLTLFRQRIYVSCYRSHLTDHWAYVHEDGRSIYTRGTTP